MERKPGLKIAGAGFIAVASGAVIPGIGNNDSAICLKAASSPGASNSQ